MNSLIIKFPDQSSSFTYGVEFGRLLQKMEQGDYNISNNGVPVRVENKELLIVACNYLGYVYLFGKELDGWIEFIAIKKYINNN